jgi:hypothetical protein
VDLDTHFGASRKSECVAIDAEGVTVDLQPDLKAIGPRIAYDEVPTGASAAFEDTEVDLSGCNLEWLRGGNLRGKCPQEQGDEQDGGAERSAPSEPGWHQRTQGAGSGGQKRKSDQLTRMPKKRCRSSTFIE